MSNPSKFRNVSVSVAIDAPPMVGQVCDARIETHYEFSGEIRQHQAVALPAGRVQQQQLYPGSGGWVNTDEPFVSAVPTALGFDLSLKANTGVQYVFLGA